MVYIHKPLLYVAGFGIARAVSFSTPHPRFEQSGIGRDNFQHDSHPLSRLEMESASQRGGGGGQTSATFFPPPFCQGLKLVRLPFMRLVITCQQLEIEWDA